MCNYKKNGTALADARFFQLLHLQSESVTAVKVNTGNGVEKSGEHRSVGRNYRPSPGEDPHGAAENRILAFAIAVQRSMDIRRSPLSFDGYTATTPTAVTLSDTP